MESLTISAKIENCKEIAYAIFNQINGGKPPVFMCVGSDRVVADSLAPIVSELLRKKYKTSAYIYGGLDYNINATNLIECYNYITTIHADSNIILVDASLGENIGDVSICSGAFAGMGKVMPARKMGDMSILGVVGKNGKDFRLNTVRLKEIVNMAKVIAKAIAMAVETRNKFYKN